MSSIPRITEYEIQEKLGSGSYATVYKARHKKNSSYHAIKCVEKSELSSSSTDNLITEIKLLKSLHHKHIVGLTDFFWDDKKIYILLEYCNAGNLSNFIRARSVLPEGTCKYFLRQLGSAMEYMRSNNVSHFDLKPQNLLLIRQPNIILKVADFGFAQHLKIEEFNSSIKGSPLYMAPEIVLKREYNAQADLWSIGVILYECLYGKAPYSSKSIEEVLSRIKKLEKIYIPRNSKISADCEDLLTRLLQHDPVKRISFNEFFNHPFIDLNSFPSDKSLKLAIEIVTKAVEYDNQENYFEAYHLYCKALQYFGPLIEAESDAAKRLHLRNKATSYLNRAEEIKTEILSKEILNSTSSSSCSYPTESAKTNVSITKALEANCRFKTLYSQSNSSPILKDALDMGRKGEMYLYEKNFEPALDSFKSALNIMVPFLGCEPEGERKALLLQQIDFWMKEAESIKSILTAKNDINDEPTSSSSNCKIS